jgi:hypothetical protein
MILSAFVHRVPAAAIVSIVVGFVLLFGRLWDFAGDELGRDSRRYRQRRHVYRSAGIALLVLGAIAYVRAG